jgi:adenosine kinase
MVESSSKILGIGNPLLDISAEVPLSVLERYNLTLGSAILASPEHLPLFQELIDQYQVDYVAGGATQNAIRAAQVSTIALQNEALRRQVKRRDINLRG